MNIVVIGAQWGDEGKGKIVDYLAGKSDVIVRFSGGANAGHTIVTEKDTYKLHLVPSGIIYPDKITILGTGMVIDPEALEKELAVIKEQGVDWEGRVLISDRAHLVLPSYKEEDMEREKQRDNPIGTTGRGIGITYAKKAYREGIRVGDLFVDEVFTTLPAATQEFLTPYREAFRGMVVDITSYIYAQKGKHILFEGAQGTLLDLDVGTYPFVSSGMAAAAGAAAGGGIGPRAIDMVMGVFKAYSTRVGNGPFPSEFTPERDGDLENTIREIGREYGVTTGRPRRCGYLDLPALRYACRANSIDSLVLTHLDVYDDMDEIKACVAYEIDGETVDHFPASAVILDRAKPVLQTFKGWGASIRDIARFDDLPREAREYIHFIENFTETRIDIVSVGYERKQTILRRGIWILS